MGEFCVESVNVCANICVYVFPRGTSNAVERDLMASNALISLGSGQVIKLLNTSNPRIHTVTTFAR